MKNTKISREVLIKAPIKEVWKILSDIGNICNASPGVTSSYSTSELKSGLGATRHCDFAMMGASVEEKVIAYNEGESFTIDVYEINKLPGIKTMKAEFKLSDKGEATLLQADLIYSVSNPLFDLMNVLMMKKMNTKSWEGLLAGYKKHIETGEIINKDTVLDYSVVKEPN